MPNEEQPMLPGFEYMADDEKKHAEDKRLKKILVQLVDDFTEYRDSKYASPAALAHWEGRIKEVMKAREDLWKEPERDA